MDAKIIVRPTDAFCLEQMKTNLHINELDGAVITTEGHVVTEPVRAEHPSFNDYQDARTAFLTGQRMKSDTL